MNTSHKRQAFRVSRRKDERGRRKDERGRMKLLRPFMA
jgi:hypothetical protein